MSGTRPTALIGKRELKAMGRVVLMAGLFMVPFVLNHEAHANYGMTQSSGAGFVIYMSLMQGR
ncbi:MAG: hypothetical protein AAFP80_02415 [Pseudomonadota bacterium]